MVLNSSDGTFLLQIGEAGKTRGSNNTEFLGHPADIEVDPETNEVYLPTATDRHTGECGTGEPTETCRTMLRKNATIRTLRCRSSSARVCTGFESRKTGSYT